MMKIAILILTLFILLPQTLSQKITNQSSIVDGHCEYFLDFNNRYTCDLFVSVLHFPSDVLNISGTHLQGFTDDDVHAVYVRGFAMYYFNGEVLQKFLNLKFLDITSNLFLHFIHQDAFEVCGQLEEFNIETSHLASFPSQMLRNCVNLRIFNAGFGEILSSIPEDLFGNTTNLEVFVASRNLLTSIPDNLLHNMVNLRIFDVHGSRINSLSSIIFTNVRNLERIDISHNNISDQSAIMNLLQSQLGLRRIIISFNPFRMFNLIFFMQFSNLWELEVGGRHPITGISWFFSSNTLTILRVFFIGENMPENAFYGFPNLRFLHLTGNTMRPSEVGLTIHKNTFKMSPALESLRIANARLSPLVSELFSAQGNLRHLEIRNCWIEELPDGIFTPLVNLGFDGVTDSLNLDSNQIHRLQLSAFGHHPRLRNIMIGRNRINEIQRGLFSRFTNGTIFARFGDNICINQTFSQLTNLDDHPALQGCFDNFEESLISATTTVMTTTPNHGHKFNKSEIIIIIFIGFLLLLVQ